MATAAMTTAQSAWLTLTGVGTEMHHSTPALEDDEGAISRTESGGNAPLSTVDNSSIVKEGPGAEEPTWVLSDSVEIRHGSDVHGDGSGDYGAIWSAQKCTLVHKHLRTMKEPRDNLGHRMFKEDELI